MPNSIIPADTLLQSTEILFGYLVTYEDGNGYCRDFVNDWYCRIYYLSSRTPSQ